MQGGKAPSMTAAVTPGMNAVAPNVVHLPGHVGCEGLFDGSCQHVAPSQTAAPPGTTAVAPKLVPLHDVAGCEASSLSCSSSRDGCS